MRNAKRGSLPNQHHKTLLITVSSKIEMHCKKFEIPSIIKKSDRW
jgi:hypothetical protein